MLHLRTLGTLDLRRDDGSELISVISQPKRIGLLYYLALARPRGFHRRDTLVPFFWPEADDEHARASLRQAVYYLRRSLGEHVVLSRGDEEVGLAAGALSCDAVAFEEALEAGEVERALDLYHGELLPGLYVENAPEFERWLEGERARLHERALKGAWALAEARAQAGDAAGTAHWAHRTLELAPTDERMLRACMELLDRVGDAGAAGEAYEGYARRLHEEYELEPSPELRAWAEEIRARGKRPAPRARTVPAAQAGRAPVPTAAESPVAAAAVAATSTPSATGGAGQPGRRVPVSRVALVGIGAVLLAAAIVGFTVQHRRSHHAPGAGAGSASIAVLPFTDLSRGHDQAYFADGITSELIELLGQIPGIRVPGLTSSFYFKGKSLPLKEIARQLGVAHVLEGSVLRTGRHVRVSVRLTSAASDRQLWAHSYETPNADVSDVQHQIARYLASRLGVAAADFPTRSPRNPEAYDLYFQGLFTMRQAPYEPGTINLQEEKAIGVFRRALDLDPGFAPAWAGLARAHYFAGDFTSAEQEGRHALALDSTLVNARIALSGSLAYGQWKWTEAEQELERGLRLTPSVALLYEARAHLRGALGRGREASADFERAEELDPSGAYLGGHAIYLANVGRWREALSVLNRIPGNDPPALQPEYRMPPDLSFTRFKVYLANGLRAQARAILPPDVDELWHVILRGNPEEGLRFARRPGMVRSPPIWSSSFLCGVLLSARAPRTGGDAASAPSAAKLHELVSTASELYYQHLEREVRAHTRWAATDLRSWAADSLRSQPRFQRLMRQVGLPD